MGFDTLRSLIGVGTWHLYNVCYAIPSFHLLYKAFSLVDAVIYSRIIANTNNLRLYHAISEEAPPKVISECL